MAYQKGTFEYIDEKIRQVTTNKELGDSFEWLCKFYLENAPQYRGQFKKVWFWKDWSKKWGPDTGIDLVAETNDGKLWAIQAKGINPERSIPKSELDSFLSESSRQTFDYRLIIATTDDVGVNARRTIAGQQKPVGFVLRGALLETELMWPDHIGGEVKQLPKKNPRPHQMKAINDVEAGFQKHKKGKLLMACGTGKTLTALWIHERLHSKRTLLVVPSLSLISQTLAAWSGNATDEFERLIVCSDETVSEKSEDHAVSATSDLGVEVTTDPKDIRNFLQKKHTKPVIVFCTYQSSDRIAEAQKGDCPPFDLLLADEAHRCTGHVDSLFTTVLDDTKVKAKRRLFMTATPRYFTDRVLKKAEELEYELASMDDEGQFGPVFHQLSFGEAIRQDLLSDYQVAIIGVREQEAKNMAEEAMLVRTEEGMFSDARTVAAQIGLAKAMKKYDLKKIITFHSSVAKAKRFGDFEVLDSLPSIIQRLPASSKPTGKLWTAHISGQTPAGKRASLLKEFAGLPSTIRAVMTNCACLGEGVDVPVLDGVAFIDPKGSTVDIIQAVGRVIRKAEGVGIGTIVVPVFIDETEYEEDVLSSSAFKPVWQVLKALRAHDETLADELDELRLKLGKRSPYGGRVRLPSAIKVDIPTLVFKDFEQAFYVKTIESTTKKPPLNIEQILRWADEYYRINIKWPKRNSGLIDGNNIDDWNDINVALVNGMRGLRGKSSLAQLLEKERGVKNVADQSNLSYKQILKWADLYFKKYGEWPTRKSGAIDDPKGYEDWKLIDGSLRSGVRGLHGNLSLAQLLEKERGVRNVKRAPKLCLRQILNWIDEFNESEGTWPTSKSGRVKSCPGETWTAIDIALQRGTRGLKGGSSLVRLLIAERGLQNQMTKENLTEKKILQWADEYYKKHGKWPKQNSGKILSSLGDTWSGISACLRQGSRGLKSGSSLAKLLKEKRNYLNINDQEALSEMIIVHWGKVFHKKNGRLPSVKEGVIEGTLEKWRNIDNALRLGLRGLKGGSSLHKLLKKHIK